MNKKVMAIRISEKTEILLDEVMEKFKKEDEEILEKFAQDLNESEVLRSLYLPKNKSELVNHLLVKGCLELMNQNAKIGGKNNGKK